MNFSDELKRIRRFLRDPNGKIWDRDMILDIYNDVQTDLQQKTKIAEAIAGIPVPSPVHMSYTYDWEAEFVDDPEASYKCFYEEQNTGTVCTYRWEIEAVLGLPATGSDRGMHFTQPWEAWDTMTPADPAPMKFPSDFKTMKYISYDEKPLEALTERMVSDRDPSWHTRVGEPVDYIRRNVMDNEFFLYPRPSKMTVPDMIVNDPDPQYYATQQWELDENLLPGPGSLFGFTDTVNKRTHVFVFEDDLGDDADVGLRGMYKFETGPVDGSDLLGFIEGDDYDGETGTLVSRDGAFNEGTGLAADAVDAEDSVLMVYDVEPAALENDEDESVFPAFLRKYIEYGVLARCYAANTDGRIRSLGDYWQFRYELGIRIIKRFMQKRLADRDFVMRGRPWPRSGQVRKFGRLPDSYPAI